MMMSILAIITSLLIPSLKTMLKANQKLVCLTNTRTVYHSTALYCEDNDDILPYRNRYALPHRIEYSNNFDFNQSLIEQYNVDRNQFFCQSDLLEARNPTSPRYIRTYVTFSYYHDANTWNSWKAVKPNFDRLSTAYDFKYPLWGCMTISIGGQRWFGHDRPITYVPPEGQNAVYIDGSANWSDLDELEPFFKNGSLEFYWPKPL